MQIHQNPRVAVLLATYNGARFVEPQISSLKDNASPFTLHWLDDHSTDNTREVVRAAALNSKVELREWHQPQHLGVPGAFFQLLDCVDADIYLFCDQDDIWQPGKIDATVTDLLPDLELPVLCFSDPLMFYDDKPEVLQRISEVMDIKAPAALEESRSLMSNPAAGQAIGFTGPLRKLYLSHREIARSYAIMHSWWMYLIAVASGTARMLSDVPTTLYRRHANNVTAPYYERGKRIVDRITSTWWLQHRWRRVISRQAAGFVLASETLQSGPKLERLIALAKLVSTLDRRQSPVALIRLARRRAMWPSWHRALWISVSCLYSDAKF
jgi:rhamnosyltransferase